MMTASIKQLAFIGSNKHELLLYLGSILNLLDLRCVIIDGTTEQNLKHVIPVIVDDQIITYRGVDYIINIDDPKRFNNLSLNMYDVVIIDYGFNINFINEINMENQIFLVTDFMKYNVEKLGYMLKALDADMKLIKIYKDVISSKISKRYIDRKLHLDENKGVVAEYLFNLDENNYENQLNIQYNDLTHLRYLNREYQEFYRDILEELFETQIPSFKKFIRQKGGRKGHASCILEYSTWAVSNNN